MAYVELRVGSIIVYPAGMEVVTSITRPKGTASRLIKTKLLHHTSKCASRAYYNGILGDRKLCYIREGHVVNLDTEELTRIRSDLNMLSKLLHKATSTNEVFMYVIDNKIPELIEEMKPKLDLRMEVRRILEDCIGKNYSLKHIYRSTRLNPDLRPMVSVLSEFLLIPGATKDSIDAAMTMNFGVGVFNVGVKV